MARTSGKQSSAASEKGGARAGVDLPNRPRAAKGAAAGGGTVFWWTSLSVPVRSLITGLLVVAGSGLAGVALASAHSNHGAFAALGSALIVLLGWGAYPLVAGLLYGGVARALEGVLRRPLMRRAQPLQGVALWLIILGWSHMLRGGHTGGLVAGLLARLFDLIPLHLGLLLPPASAILLVLAVCGITWGQVASFTHRLATAAVETSRHHGPVDVPLALVEPDSDTPRAKKAPSRNGRAGDAYAPELAAPTPHASDDQPSQPIGAPVAPAARAPRRASPPPVVPAFATTVRQSPLPFATQHEEPREWVLPSPTLFEPAAAHATLDDDREIEALAQRLERTLRALRVDAEVRREDITVGPVVARFGIRPLERKQRDASGRPELDLDGEPLLVRTRVSRILALQSDLALALRVPSLRMEAPVPGQPYVGVEVPNPAARPVGLREVLWSDAARHASKQRGLTIALGRDAAGHARVGDLTQFPHALVAGATGSGKSVCLHSVICSLLSTHPPTDLRLLLIDPKLVELSIYDGVPHLLLPVITEVDDAEDALERIIAEMRRRFTLFSRAGVRNLDSYRRLRERQPDLEALPWIVVVVDEVANLMLGGDGRAEDLLCTLAQLARAAGIHLVIATQRPSVDVITGTIKANFPTRLAFAMASSADSRTILDAGGAEHLLGRGDMLFVSGERARPERIQGCRVLDDEIERVVAHWTAQCQPARRDGRSYVDAGFWSPVPEPSGRPSHLDGDVTIEARRAGGRTRWGWEDPFDPPHPHRDEWR
jgi:Cdc6-like AAA superfamily ATPase